MHAGPLPISDETHIGVLEAGRERVVPIAELRDRFAVDALIRLHSTDFAELPTGCRMLVHFNLETTTNKVGRRYALVPIVRSGQRLANGQELLPVVDPAQHRLGTCTEVLQRVQIGQVTTEQFAHSLPSIRTPQELREALLRRYIRMFPDLRGEEIIARGCSVTRIAFDVK
ncbi:MAG: hypothetical protein ACRYG8_33290 [Janthinobacterium lividum]